MHTLDDIREGDRIALTSLKVSIPALVMQMYASQRDPRLDPGRFDKYTVPLPHREGMKALLRGAMGVTAHFTSPPFHQGERKQPDVRTILNSNDVMGGDTTFTMMYCQAKYRAEHPMVYMAVVKALEDAVARIGADKPAAAKLLGKTGGTGDLDTDEIVDVLNDPAVVFTTTPQNVMKYATFMHDIQSIPTGPAAWTDLFFPEIHGAHGS